MKKLLAGAIVILAAGVIWLAGIRVFVIQPIGAIPEGVTLVVAGTPGLRLIDSPDAFCNRTQNGVSLLCRGAAAGAVAARGKVLLRLPYSAALYRLSGAPLLDR